MITNKKKDHTTNKKKDHMITNRKCTYPIGNAHIDIQLIMKHLIKV